MVEIAWAAIALMGAALLGFFAVIFQFGAKMDARFDALTAYMSARFNSVDDRFAGMDARFDALIGRIDARFDAVYERFDAMNARIDGLNARLDTHLGTEPR